MSQETVDDLIVVENEPRRYTYRQKTYLSLTASIEESGLGYDYSKVPRRYMERAKRRGTMVHRACEYYDHRDLDLDSVDDQIKGFVQGYIRFDTECPGKIVAIERMLVCPALGIGTTPDLVRFVRGRRAVIERKTTQVMAQSAKLQTAGQQLAWNYLYPKAPIADRYGLRLQPNGFYKLIQHTDPDDFVAFMDLLKYVKAKQGRDRWITKYGREGQL